jgi:hypothetical protein
MKLLTVGNTKTLLGQKVGYMTFILHLAPAKLSGFNVCPGSSKGCRSACLNTAGRGIYTKIQEARIRKTQWFFNDRDGFMAQLVKDIQAAERLAKRQGFTPVIRLNGTSDLRWETVAVNGEKNIMTVFPHIQFYDYTKLPNRIGLPSNYHVTFSRSESNHLTAALSELHGMNVAIVFGVKKGHALPTHYAFYPDATPLPVVDGDINDLRFLDPSGVIVGLRAKGKAKKGSHDGFVVTV